MARSSPTRMLRSAARSCSGGRRLGSLACDEPAEGSLLRRRRRAVGSRRSARPAGTRRRGWISAISRSACSSGTASGLTWRAGWTFPSPASRHSSQARPASSSLRFGSHDLEAGGRAARARPGEHRQHGRRGHVGLSRDDDRGAPDARVDGRRALALGLERARMPCSPTGRGGMWTQLLHGRSFRYLGPVRGFTGNVQSLLVSPRRQARGRFATEVCVLLEETAFVENGLANWPPGPQDALGASIGERSESSGAAECRNRRRGGALSRRGARSCRRGAYRGPARIPMPREPGSATARPGMGRRFSGLRADRRRALARAGASLRRARARAGAPSAS